MNRLLLFFLFACLLVPACSSRNPIELAMSSDSPAIQRVVDRLQQHEVQVLFSEVQRRDDGGVQFIDHSFQVDDSTYFYPASTVKFPVALLALEKLQEIEQINRYSRFSLGEESAGSSFTNDIIKLFVLSDNDAYNRLFEFLGQDEINKRLQEKNLVARISHRLSIPDSDRLQTSPMRFSTDSSPYTVGPINNRPIDRLALDKLSKGIAYIENGERVAQAFDFAEKNYLPLTSLHGIMKRFIFPTAFPMQEQFRLDEEHREFVLRAMRTLPRQAGFSEQEYPDSFVKFLLVGDSDQPIPERYTIYNKVGFAYGYLTDCAYIVDAETGREFLITATVHVNANQTFNDDEYEYDSVGIPFLAELGRQLIAY